MPEKFTVVIAEDEPISLKHICFIVNERCPAFTVIATSSNGIEALNAVAQHRPDLLITDVKMPGMDGIALAKAVRLQFPETVVLLVSGYQDFPYVQGALSAKASDYLLKPVTPTNLVRALRALTPALLQEKKQKFNLLLKKILLSGSSPEGLESELSTAYYIIALARKNALPPRYNHPFSLDIAPWNDQSHVVYGRDRGEILVLEKASNKASQAHVRHNIRQIIEQWQNENPGKFVTTVINPNPKQLSESQDVIEELVEIMRRSLIIGETQVIDACEVQLKSAISKEDIDNSISVLSYLIQSNLFDEFRHEMRRTLQHMEKNRCTQLDVERFVYRVYLSFLQHAKKEHDELDYETRLDHAFSMSKSYSELVHRTMAIFEDIIASLYGTFNKIDSAEFFAAVSTYINRNYRSGLNMHDLCKVFGISETYMSRLFSKYKKCTFRKFLNAVRIDAAKKLMQEQPGLSVKYVAEMVGYGDHFYFSKKFKELTGIPPSRYIDTPGQRE